MTNDLALTQLIDRCQQGDLEAFAALFRRFRQHVYDLARVILRDEQAAQDAVQDTFLRLLQKIDSFNGEAAFETWLTAVTVNICRSQLRRRKLRRFLSLDALRTSAAAAPRTEQLVAARLQRQSLWALVDSLPDRLRLPLILRYRYALPCAEIAAALDLRLATVYQQLHEGRRRLALLAEQQEDSLELPFAPGEQS